jgi:hypothetical protein
MTKKNLDELIKSWNTEINKIMTGGSCPHVKEDCTCKECIKFLGVNECRDICGNVNNENIGNNYGNNFGNNYGNNYGNNFGNNGDDFNDSGPIFKNYEKYHNFVTINTNKEYEDFIDYLRHDLYELELPEDVVAEYVEKIHIYYKDNRHSKSDTLIYADEIYKNVKEQYVYNYLKENVESLLYDFELSKHATDERLRELYQYGLINNVDNFKYKISEFLKDEVSNYENYLEKHKYKEFGATNINDYVDSVRSRILDYEIPDDLWESIDFELANMERYNKSHRADEVVEKGEKLIEIVQHDFKQKKISQYEEPNILVGKRKLNENIGYLNKASEYNVNYRTKRNKQEKKSNKRKERSLVNKQALKNYKKKYNKQYKNKNKAINFARKLQKEVNENRLQKDTTRLQNEVYKKMKSDKKYENLQEEELQSEVTKEVNKQLKAKRSEMLTQTQVLNTNQPRIQYQYRYFAPETEQERQIKEQERQIQEKAKSLAKRTPILLSIYREREEEKKIVREKGEKYKYDFSPNIIENVSINTYTKKGYTKPQRNKIEKVLKQKEKNTEKKDEEFRQNITNIISSADSRKKSEATNESYENRIYRLYNKLKNKYTMEELEQLVDDHDKSSFLNTSVSPEIAALDQEYEHLMRKKQREKLQNKEAIQKYLKVKEEPNSESDSESELNEDISPKNKMNKELKKYKIAPTNNNLNKFENYREASDAYDKFVFENPDYFVGNNAIIKEHDKLKQNLDNIENKILKQKLKQVKLEKIQKKVAKKRIIKEGEKIISKKLKEKRIARKQKELEKEQKEPSPEKLKKVFTKEKNKISQMLNKELQKLRRNLDTLSIKAREGDPKAKKGLNTKQQNLKSKIKNKAQELINRLKEIKAEKSAENIENFLEEFNFS